MLSVLLRFMDSDCAFGIFKLFLYSANYLKIIFENTVSANLKRQTLYSGNKSKICFCKCVEINSKLIFGQTLVTKCF